MMPDLLVYLLKMNGALLLFAVVYYALLRRLTFHTLNRWYLLGAIIFSALYPLLDVAALWPQPVVLSDELIIWQYGWQGQVVAGATPTDYYGWGMKLYWLGVAVLSGRLLMQAASLRRLHNASVPTSAGLPFRQVTEAVTPFSFWQTIYLNPAQHKPTELSAILLHEQVHVRQWHTLDVLLGQVLRVFCWLNPAAWLLLRVVQENLEFIADQAVLQAGQVDSKVYQYSLVRLSTLAQGPALVTPFTFHPLKNRIQMMNSQKTAAFQVVRYLLVAPLAAMLLLASCSKSEEQTAQPAKQGVDKTIDNALYFIDGEKSTKVGMEQLSPAAIASVNVLKGENARNTFGEAAASGVIIITTKANQNTPAVKAFNQQYSPTVDYTGKLIIIDGMTSTPEALQRLPESRIKTVNVLKGEPAEAQYGARARNGVIVVTTNAAGTGMLNQLYDHNGVMGITKKGC
jgi:TonB-dependent SusC/RagA subfamily outer membrane receptor